MRDGRLIRSNPDCPRLYSVPARHRNSEIYGKEEELGNPTSLRMTSSAVCAVLAWLCRSDSQALVPVALIVEND